MSIGNNIDDAKASFDSTVSNMNWDDSDKESALSFGQDTYDGLTGWYDYLTMYSDDDSLNITDLWTDTYLGHFAGQTTDAYAVQAGKFWQALRDEFSSVTYDGLYNIDGFRNYIDTGVVTASESETQGVNDYAGAINDTVNDAKSTGIGVGAIAAIAAVVFGAIALLK